ncbi:hypothetical protein ABE083_16940 [Bacillus mycoides]|uniref:Uncharacterized protein n=1 Tax=Bacillus mycoides TaxID=1405 RepID=A0A1S9TD12_BACMY|nr:hypothetical protein [Bacillus mycoides]OOR07797.1 hypothetical protein BW900_04610 [Bacillus mycoides]
MKKYTELIKQILNTKKSKQILLLLVIIIVTLLLPYLTNLLVTQLHFKHENEWVGFYGNYFGSIVAILGIYLTIRFTTKEENENRRLQIVPYIEVKYVDQEYLTNEGSGITVGDWDKYNNHMVGHLQLQNVGLGAAIDLRIQDITFRDKRENLSIESRAVIRPDQTVTVNTDIALFLQDLTNMEVEEMQEYINSGTIVMNINYKDLLNNYYTQTIYLVCSVTLEYNPEDKTGKLHPNVYLSLDDTSKPKLIHT